MSKESIDDGDVLQTLVKQFTDPLACLRELIQNAVDAGSDMVEVRAYREGNLGVFEVQDHGEGMDKGVIETKLVRLFASSKDGDLTKIGKFGVGFVSVFALEPEAVCVDTARAGERWRVVFHADRSFTLARLDEPVEGTRVRIFVKKDAADWHKLAKDGRAAVKKWCRHLDAEILFDDEPVNEPLGLPMCRITAQRDDGDGTTVIVGVGADGGVGFYNKGLTLLETTSWPDLPERVSVRLSSRWLEHTLTRDSVVKDSRYKKAIAMAKDLIDSELENRAIEAVRTLPLDERSHPLAWLAQRPNQKALRMTPLLRDINGKLQPEKRGGISRASNPMVADEASPSTRKVAAAASALGRAVLLISSRHADLDRAAISTLLGVRAESLHHVEDVYVVADDVEPVRAARVARLIEHTTAQLKAVGRKTELVGARVVGRHCRELLAWPIDVKKVTLPIAIDVEEKATSKSTYIVDVDHADIAAILELAALDTPLAAQLLARLLLLQWGDTTTNPTLAAAGWEALS